MGMQSTTSLEMMLLAGHSFAYVQAAAIQASRPLVVQGTVAAPEQATVRPGRLADRK
jgi:hypothetical protein